MNQTDRRARFLALHHFFDFCLNTAAQIDFDKPPSSTGLTLRPGKKMPTSWNEALEKAQLPIGIRAVTFFDNDYPAGLNSWHNQKPPVLYMRGGLLPDFRSLVAIVGTRNPTPFGRRNAEWFARSMVALGLGTVSGLARGVDGLVHSHSLSGCTVAVLGSAIDSIYPPEHEDLSRLILERGGVILSPYPVGQEIRPANFVRRNKIIAGLSLGCIVVEGDEKSGANTTGGFTLDLERVCITLLRDFDTPAGKGSMRLLESGAHWAKDPEHALDAISLPLGGARVLLREKKPMPAQPALDFNVEQWLKKFPSVNAGLSELERQLSLGNIESLGLGRYRNSAGR